MPTMLNKKRRMKYSRTPPSVSEELLQKRMAAEHFEIHAPCGRLVRRFKSSKLLSENQYWLSLPRPPQSSLLLLLLIFSVGQHSRVSYVFIGYYGLFRSFLLLLRFLQGKLCSYQTLQLSWSPLLFLLLCFLQVSKVG